MKTILVPIDFSAVTGQVVRVACEMARLTGSRLVLLHVIPPASAFDVYGLGSEIIMETTLASEKIAARRLLGLARRCRRKVPVVRTIQQTGPVMPVILAKAKELKPLYLVLGSHGHGAMFDLLAGSTTQGVLRRARVPVLVVPARGRD